MTGGVARPMLAGMAHELSKLSPAKINLTLRVDPLRQDGFHEIESLTARIGLSDRVTVALRDDDRIVLSCDNPAIPTDDRNLAVRAALQLQEFSGKRRGATIALEKRIPSGAGLGGGSANAAATLDLLDRLWQTELTRDELCRVGSEIGSDIPLFFHGGCCLIRGRGEQVVDAALLPAGWAVLILPPFEIATAAVYAAWDELNVGSDERARTDPQSLVAEAASLEALMPSLFNDLEAPARRVSRPLDEGFERLAGLSDVPVRMTGSGSCMFRLFDGRAAADRFAREAAHATSFRVEVVSFPAE
ncbi:MAG: 4-(cytidine 5'-diphospho)-2-C-methyl-D-erythritol kinase [Planctomycetes bacterium]|nr:4-(cytidine 5'-diphospho)-2-C-methyl-D-erythritol kinase [Planctomycetota bacterium]